jgi:predicted tellurium resistance membrane protein TerC
MLELFSQPQTWVSLITLILMEIVLGMDNIVFISILVGRLPKSEQEKARCIGLVLALGFRVAMLCGITWIAGLITPLFTLFDFSFSGRDLILLGGGLFLIAKSTTEIHGKLEGEEEQAATNAKSSRNVFSATVLQVVMLDIVFSIDSVITAIGLAQHVVVMIAAVIVALGVMLVFSRYVSAYIHKHPSLKMLALSFLLMIGLLLFAEGLHAEVPKGYVYFAMAFSLLVEALNIRVRAKTKPVILHEEP